jgi:hypothetical protein
VQRQLRHGIQADHAAVACRRLVSQLAAQGLHDFRQMARPRPEPLRRSPAEKGWNSRRASIV